MSTGKIILQVQSMIMLAVLLVACGSSTPETPIAASTINITNISENNVVVGQIVQKKTFNQCASASPIRATIQFIETSGQTSQKALVLSETGGIQVGLPKTAELKMEAAIEEHFSVTNERARTSEESVSIEVPAYTRQEYTIIWNETRREGTIEYMENGEKKFINYSYRMGVELASSSVSDINCALPTEPPFPTITPPPTITPEPIVEVPATQTPLPVPLSNGCISSQIWEPYSSNAPTLGQVLQRQDGCYSLEAPGMFTDNNGALNIKVAEQRDSVNFGLYTPIKNGSTIEFNIHVNYMYIVYEGRPSAISFAIAPAGDLANVTNSTRFNLTVLSPGKEPVIHYFLADAGENTGTRLGTQHYEYGHNYDIRFELSGNSMKVFIDGYKMQEELFIPTGQKIFYIGYDIPAISGVDMSISNVKVDGVAK